MSFTRFIILLAASAVLHAPALRLGCVDSAIVRSRYSNRGSLVPQAAITRSSYPAAGWVGLGIELGIWYRVMISRFYRALIPRPSDDLETRFRADHERRMQEMLTRVRGPERERYDREMMEHRRKQNARLAAQPKVTRPPAALHRAPARPPAAPRTRIWSEVFSEGRDLVSDPLRWRRTRRYLNGEIDDDYVNIAYRDIPPGQEERNRNHAILQGIDIEELPSVPNQVSQGQSKYIHDFDDLPFVPTQHQHFEQECDLKKESPSALQPHQRILPTQDAAAVEVDADELPSVPVSCEPAVAVPIDDEDYDFLDQLPDVPTHKPRGD